MRIDRRHYTFIVLLAISLAGCAQQMDKATSLNLSVEEFKQKVEQDSVQLLDVRTEREVKAGMIQGAVAIDYFSPDFLERASTFDKSKPLYVYCASGVRSSKAIAKLKNQGFVMLYNLSGGFNTWKQRGYDISK